MRPRAATPMSKDLYAEASALAGNLADAGHSEWERRIHNAIAGGATATEILMALRWTLSEMLLRDEGIRDSLRDNASRLRNELDQALSDVNSRNTSNRDEPRSER